MSAEGRFLTGSTLGHVVRMTLTGAAGITFVFIVDAMSLYWVSRLGDTRMMAAIGFAFAIQFFSVSSGIGLMIAATVLVSRAIGAADRDKARRLAGSGLLISCVVQACMAATVIYFRYDILMFSGAQGETLEFAARYLLLTLPSLVLMVIGMVGSGVLRAEGDGKRAMFITLTAGVVSFFLDPLLIYVLGLGLDGAAIGLNVSRFVLHAMALYFTTRVYDLIEWPTAAGAFADLRPYMAVAIPAILTQMATPFGNYVLTAVLSEFGDEAVAGWAVVARLTVVAFGGIFALSGAIGGIFGQNYGAGQYDRLTSTYRDAMIFCLGYTLMIWAILVFVGPAVGDGFGLAPDGFAVLLAFTHFGAGAFIFTGAFFVSNAAFNALGRPTRATILTWIRDGVLTWPVAVWFAGIAGAVGVIYAQAALGIIIGLVSAIWGWHFVKTIAGQDIDVDLKTRRGWRDLNTLRRR